MWVTIGLREDLFRAITTYYPMMLAMVFGSMIAGATPLGGGVVAFPVAVLVLGFVPGQGRDFSLMIQSVGMSAASFLIVYWKQHLVEGRGEMLGRMVLMSVIGLIVGFELLGDASPYVVNIVYTTTVVCLVIVFFYDELVRGRLGRAQQCVQSNTDNLPSEGATETTKIDAENADHNNMESTVIAEVAQLDVMESHAGEDDSFRESEHGFDSDLLSGTRTRRTRSPVGFGWRR